MKIQVWNRKSEDLWGMRAEEVKGMHFLNLDIGLPVERLRHAIRACLTGDKRTAADVVDARNRRGKEIRCRVVCGALVDGLEQIRGVMMHAEEIEDYP